MSAPIALLTDFGLSDSYVGVMKGVIARIAPDAPIIDITHAIRPQDILHGAYTLAISAPYFPMNTIFCCVVDPGVGSDRAPIAVAINSWRFVLPDNGLITFLVDRYKLYKVVALDNMLFHRQPVSATFHGRDIFAPVAAHLALGKAIEQVGSRVDADSIRRMEIPAPSVTLDEVVGHVLHIDHFGNIVTTLRDDHLQKETGWTVYLGYQRIIRNLELTYSAVAMGSPVAYVGSDGYLEIAIRNGNAAATYHTTVGQEVRLRRSAAEPEIPVDS